jgi:hypothetical protein
MESIMKKALIAAILAGLLSGNTFASHSNQSDTLCTQSIGHWSGTFTLKNENECQQYGGCTHYVMADLSSMGGNQYLMNLQPSSGMGGQVPLTCENGKLTSEYIPGGVAYINCSSSGLCSVDYDDARLISHMHKQVG